MAIVSAKPADHFRSSPDGYSHGLVAKAKVGEQNLARTIWELRARPEGEGGAFSAPDDLMMAALCFPPRAAHAVVNARYSDAVEDSRRQPRRFVTCGRLVITAGAYVHATGLSGAGGVVG